MECRKPLVTGEVGNVVVEARVESPNVVLHEITIGDESVEVTKTAHHGLHASAVRQHGEIALQEGAKL